MKNLFKYFLYSLIFLLVSCADEGPFEVGQFDIQAEADQVTATTAIVKVKVPESKKQLLKSIGNLRINGKSDYENGISINQNTISDIEKCFILTNLKPSTTYEVEVTAYPESDNGWGAITIYAAKFTTAKEGDYSALHLEATCELVRKIDDKAWVNITLPSELKIQYPPYPTLLCSTSSELTDPVSTTLQTHGDNILSAILEKVENEGEYYLAVIGDFKYTNNSTYYNQEISLPNIQIPIKNSLIINSQNTEATGDDVSAQLLMTKKYAENDSKVSAWIKFELNPSSNIYFNEEDYKVSWSETKEFNENSSSTTFAGFMRSGNTMCDNLEIGKSYYFKIEGNIRYHLPDGTEASGNATIYTSEPLTIVEKGTGLFTCELIMATKTMTSVKIKLPKGVTFESGEHHIYWRNADNSVSSWESKIIEGDHRWDSEITVTLPALTPNENGYQLSIDGPFRFDDFDSLSISTMLYSAENLLIKLSEIPTSTCSLEFYYGNEAVVNFQLADNLRFDGKGTVLMNTAEDFSGQSVNTEYPYSATSNFRIQLKGLNPSDTYYFRLKGDFKKEENGSTNFLRDEIIDVKGSIKLSGSEKTITPGTCELVTSGDNFNIVRLKFPQKISTVGGSPHIYYNESEHFNIEDLTTTNAIASMSNYEITGNLPKLEVGKTYYFKTQTDIYYDENFLFKDVIIPYSGSVTRPQMDINKANYETVFDCKDFTALKLNMPKGIEVGSSIKLKYSSDNDPISVNGTTMFFKSLNPATYNLSINGDAFYRDNNFHIRLERINMELAEPFTPTPGDKYLIDVTLFKDGSKECIALTRSSELVKFNINTSAACIKTSETDEINLENKNQTDGRLTYEIPANYTLIEGQEYTIRYYAQIEFIDKEKYGNASYNLNASYSLIYSSTETKEGARSTLKSRRLTKLKTASISSLSKNKSPRKTTRRNKTAVKKTTAKR